MEVLSVHDGLAVETACLVLKQGGVIVHPTETCYGLAADLTNEAAVRRLFALKERAEDKPVSGLFGSVAEAARWVEWNDQAEALAAEHLPGPLTLILPIRADAPAPLWPCPAGSQTLGVRISSHEFAEALASAYGSPLSTTSANRSGEANPYSVAAILATWSGTDDAPNLILDGGDLPEVPPSTVMDFTKGGKVRRQGMVV